MSVAWKRERRGRREGEERDERGRGEEEEEERARENVKASNFYLREPRPPPSLFLSLMEFLGLRVTVPSNPRTLWMCSGMQGGDRARN